MNATQIERSNPNRWFAIAGVGLGAMMTALDASIINISLPTLEEHFSTTFAAVQWVVLSYILVLTSLTLGAARLGDMMNKKRLYLLGLGLFTLSSALCASAPTVGWLIAFRALQGLGGTLTQALGFAIITEVFSAQERGKALGVMGSIVSIGIASGPALGGIIIGTVGWRWVFLVNLPIGLIALAMVMVFVPDLHATRGDQVFDLPGAAVMFFTLGAFAAAMTWGQDAGFDAPLVLVLLAASAAGLGVFLAVERRSPQPMVDLSLFNDFLFNLNLFMGLLVSMVLAGLFILPYYLELVKGYPTALVGVLMMIDPLGMALLAPLAGTLSDRFGSRSISILGLAVVVIGCLTLGALEIETTQVGFVLHMIPIGLGMGMFAAPNNSAIMGSAPRERLGITSGLLTLSRTLGQTMGLPVMGALFSGFTAYAAQLPPGVEATKAPAAALVAGTQGAFHVAALGVFASLLCAVAAWVVDMRRKRLANIPVSAAAED